MRLLGVTDLHGNRSALDRILTHAGQADMILLGGDLTNFGSPSDAEAIVRQAQGTGAIVLCVAGNCDSAQIDNRLGEIGVSLHGCGLMYQGVALHGLSGMPPWQRRMYQFSEEELAAALAEGYAQINSAKTHVVLAHPPPHGCRLDRTFLFKHVGSTALREFIEQKQPALVICGHIHEARGIERLGPTTVANCGAGSSGHYAIAEVDDEINVALHRA